ncbi:hypothetical protein SteCoe_21844 [Stentor coeruleus]|uniref:Uncharacterized protein n=1 Tax=Stentor coeruleus TaxID=5963 RepID=A0A1R2BNK6_9CILI|nr:hypothetical protein SteCoe_21844 [Stentor coeruleus]
MHSRSEKFLQEISEKIKKLKEFSSGESINDLAQIADDMSQLINKTDYSPSGIPPPDDIEYSFNSLNSSISVPDGPITDQLNLIKTKNMELRRTATLTIQDFKNTSRNLLSKSQLQSGKGSIILHELETVKKNLDEVYEEAQHFPNRAKSITPQQILVRENEENMALVYKKIQDIQKEINEAAQRLMESEKMIYFTEEKNQTLENRIKKLEDSVSSVLISEGPEKSRSENCMCILS